MRGQKRTSPRNSQSRERDRAPHQTSVRRNAPRQTSVRREACPPAHQPRRELRSPRRLEARPGPAGLAPPSDRATMTTGTATTTPHTSLPFFLWLPRLLLQHSTTAGNTADEISEHSGSQRDKTLPAQLISRSNGTKFSLLVIKRSFWPVLRMQGEFYPGYDVRGPQQGEFCPGILVALGLQPGSAMIIHVLLARQRP